MRAPRGRGIAVPRPRRDHNANGCQWNEDNLRWFKPLSREEEPAFNHMIRQVLVNGIIVTCAGNGIAGFGGDNGPATSAALKYPLGVAVVQSLDSNSSGGNRIKLFIADGGNHRVRLVNEDGIIITIAGTGVAGFSGDGGPATSATINFPHAVLVVQQSTGSSVNSTTLYFTGSSAHIHRVSTNGTITTLAGTGVSGYSSDGSFATASTLGYPIGMSVMNKPSSIHEGADEQTFFFTEYDNYVIRMLAADGTIRTVVGNRTAGYSAGGGSAKNAMLSRPHHVQVLPMQSGIAMYISEGGNHCVRRVIITSPTISPSPSAKPSISSTATPNASQSCSATAKPSTTQTSTQTLLYSTTTAHSNPAFITQSIEKQDNDTIKIQLLE
ncbi:MAG: hypothetical protein EOO65_02780 [Methanosarcinales archaeon]|nr:MAG: hypothetical protein EOO65_02780 [Methanosarcinales archaeon]